MKNNFSVVITAEMIFKTIRSSGRFSLEDFQRHHENGLFVENELKKIHHEIKSLKHAEKFSGYLTEFFKILKEYEVLESEFNKLWDNKNYQGVLAVYDEIENYDKKSPNILKIQKFYEIYGELLACCYYLEACKDFEEYKNYKEVINK